LYTNGKTCRVGIREALTRAGRIRQIAASNPMDNVAILRLLLAVVQWCKPTLTDAERNSLEGADGIRTEWLGKLGTEDEPCEAFELLKNSHNFMQAPVGQGSPRPVADLFHELPGATNKAFFHHITDYREGICLSCLALGLTRLPVAITAKGQGKHTGINGDVPIYFIPSGSTLLQTLLLNYPFDRIEGDKPCWEQGFAQRGSEAPVGIMEGFTWIPRQFAIDKSRLTCGVCIMCSRHTNSLVTGLKEVNAPNGRSGLSRSPAWKDPHLAYIKDGKSMRPGHADKNLPTTAGEWREWLCALTDSESLPKAVAIALERAEPTEPVHVMLAGLAVVNDKSVESCYYTVEMSGLRSALLEKSSRLDELVSKYLNPQVTKRGKALMTFKKKHPLRVIRYADRPLPDSVRAALADRLPTLEHKMSDAVRRSIAQPGQAAAVDIQLLARETEWYKQLEQVARATAPGSPLRRLEATRKAQKLLADAIGNGGEQ